MKELARSRNPFARPKIGSRLGGGIVFSGRTAPEASGIAEDLEGGGVLAAIGCGLAWTAERRRLVESSLVLSWILKLGFLED